MQVLFAVLFGFAAVTVHGNVSPFTDMLEKTLEVFFRLVQMIKPLAPLGAYGAMVHPVVISRSEGACDDAMRERAVAEQAADRAAA